MPDIFLSYSREDQVTARRFADALQREGFSVWWDQALDAGESFDKVTEQALKDAKAVVVLWSKNSVDSRWVRAEATQADRFGTLVPVTIESCNRPIMFELTHTADLSGWNGDTSAAPWRAFIEGLRRTVGKTQTSTATLTATPEVDMSGAPRPFPHAAIAWTIIAAAVLLAAGFFYFQGRQAAAPGAATHAPVTATPATHASIAVLPFKDMSQKKDQEYFADGVTEEILNTLAGLKDLKVTARTSAFAFKGKDVDLRTVGETLGVQHILEGSIRKDGDTLRITAQLIDVKSDAHVWSKTYERPLKDIFKIQDEIARSVAEALQVSLGVGFGNQPGMTRDVEAYDAFLASEPLLIFQNAESQRRAIGLLEQAVARDPAFVNAWVRLSDSYGRMTVLSTDDAPVWQQKADTALDNARRLAPDSLAVRLALSRISADQNHWVDAARQLEDLKTEIARVDVLRTDPRGIFFLMVGRAREALAELEQEKARDPLNPYTSLMLAVAYSSVRNFPASIAEFDRGYSLDPSMQFQFQLSTLSNALGTRDRAEIRRLQIQISSAPGARPELGSQLIPLLDKPADALVHLQKQLRDPSTPVLQLAGVSQWLAYFGDAKTALEAHRRALEHRATMPAAFSIWFPVMSEVRKLPEFKQLVRDIGLVDYWKKYGWGDFCKPVGETDFECH